MSAQRQEPIDFAVEGLRLELSVNRNCGIRVQDTNRLVQAGRIREPGAAYFNPLSECMLSMG